MPIRRTSSSKQLPPRPARRLFARMAVVVTLATPIHAADQSATSTALIQSLPAHLRTLYHAYPNLHATLGQYADSQGFRRPQERLATIIHELIHIDSASRGAYVVHGLAYDPYGDYTSWPTYRLSDFRDAITRVPGSHHQDLISTPVFRLYVGNAPDNRLANLADELNAYGQTVLWLCERRTIPGVPDESNQSVQSMRDMLRLTNAFLGYLRTSAPSQYAALHGAQRPARNLLALTIISAQAALAQCGLSLPLPDRGELDAITARARAEAPAHIVPNQTPAL